MAEPQVLTQSPFDENQGLDSPVLTQPPMPSLEQQMDAVVPEASVVPEDPDRFYVGGTGQTRITTTPPAGVSIEVTPQQLREDIDITGEKIAVTMTPKRGDIVTFKGDFDLSRMFLRGEDPILTPDILSKAFYNPETDTIRTLQNFDENAPQNYTPTDYINGKLPDGSDDPRSVISLLREMYGDEHLLNLQKNDPDEYTKFVMRHIYRGIKQNPRLESYFKRYHSEELDDVSQQIMREKILLGKDALNQPIYAGQEFSSMSAYGLGPRIPEEPTWDNPLGSSLRLLGVAPTEVTADPFDDESLQLSADISRKSQFWDRITYDTITGLGSWLIDPLLDPKNKALDFFQYNGEQMGIDPKELARLSNKIFGLGKGITGTGIFRPLAEIQPFAYLPEGPFSEEEIENITSYEQVFNRDKELKDSGYITGETPIDIITNYLAAAPWAGPLGLTASEQKDRRFNIPSGDPLVGKFLDETFGQMALTIFGGRVGLEAFKSFNFKRLDDIDPVKFLKGVRVIRSNADDVAKAKKIYGEKAVEEMYQIIPKQILRKANFLSLHAQEQALGTGAVLVNEYLPTMLTEEGTTGNFLERLFLNITVPTLMLAVAPFVAKSALDFALWPTARMWGYPILRGNFSMDMTKWTPEMREVLKTNIGKKVWNNFAKAHQTLVQSNPKQYENLVAQWRSYNKGMDTLKTTLKTSVLKKTNKTDLTAAEATQIEEMLDALAKGRASARELIHVESSIAAYQQTAVKRMGGVHGEKMRGRRLAKSIEESQKLKEVVTRHEDGMVALGEIVQMLTINATAFKNNGVEIPKKLQETISDITRVYADSLPVPKEFEETMVNALHELYSIDKWAKSSKANQGQILTRVETLWDKLGARDPSGNLQAEFVNQTLKIMDVNTTDTFAKGLGSNFKDDLEKFAPIMETVERHKNNTKKLDQLLYENGLLTEDGFLPVGARPEMAGQAKTQFNLVTKRFSSARTEASKKYEKLYGAFGNQPLVSGKRLIKELHALSTKQGLSYGIDARNSVLSVLRDVHKALPAKAQGTKEAVQYLQQNFDDLVKLPEDEVMKIIDGLVQNEKTFTLRETVKLRGDVGKNAWDAIKNRDYTLSTVYMKMHNILDTTIDSSLKGTKGGQKVRNDLKQAQKNYKETVGEIFYDPYIIQGLKAGEKRDIGLPFNLMFANNIAAGPTRRQVYDRMFGGASEEVQAAAREQMRLTMLARIHESQKTPLSANQFKTALRTFSEPSSRSGQQLFHTRGNGGFRDFVVPRNTKELARLNRETPFQTEDGRFLYRNTSEIADLRASLQGHAFLNPDGGVNKANIKEVMKHVVRVAEDQDQIDMSITMPKMQAIAASKETLADASKSLLDFFLDEAVTDTDTLARVQSFFADVNKYTPDNNEFMVESLKKLTIERLHKIGGIPESTGAKVPVTERGFTQYKRKIQQKQLTIRELLGPEQAESINSLVEVLKIYESPTTLLEMGSEVSAYTFNAYVSRFWGMARGVVSARYVAGEAIAKKFVEMRNKSTIAVLSTPGFADTIMDSLQKNLRTPFVDRPAFMARFIPAIAGSMIATKGSDYDKELQENIQLISDFCQSSKENDTDCLVDIASLLFALRGVATRKALLGEPLNEEEQKIIKRLDEEYKNNTLQDSSKQPINDQMREILSSSRLVP